MKIQLLIPKHRLHILLFLLTLTLISESGCVVAIRTGAAQSDTEESATEPATINRFFWGALWNTKFLVPDSTCPSQGMQTVRFKTTFWESAVTIVTLGIYCPIDVTWACIKKKRVRPDSD